VALKGYYCSAMKKIHIASSLLLCFFLVAATGCHSSKRASSSSEGKTHLVAVTQSDDKASRDDPDRVIAAAIVEEAYRWIGTPYKYGGQSRRGTDCSGLVVEVYSKVAGLKLPRSSREQQSWCRRISRAALHAGDLVFFASKAGGSRVGHVGIYIGDNRIIHASGSRGVIISNLSEDYYRRHFYSAGRVEGITYACTGRKLPREERGKSEKSEHAKTAPEITLDSLVRLNQRLQLRLEQLELRQVPSPVPEPVSPTPAPQPEPEFIPIPQPELRIDTLEMRSDSIRDVVRRALIPSFRK